MKPIKKFAVGGFPEDGLFMANHNELVGQFAGGKTAVANNLQIQAGIEEAAYRGYARAIIEFGESQSSSDNIVVENVWKTSNETLYRSSQRGKQKSSRRYQVVSNPV
jgi:hypothetical protein